MATMVVYFLIGLEIYWKKIGRISVQTFRVVLLSRFKKSSTVPRDMTTVLKWVMYLTDTKFQKPAVVQYYLG